MKAPIDDPFNVTEGLEKYPKILHYDGTSGHRYGGVECIAFEKWDGSNLAWKWDGCAFDVPTFRSGRPITEELGTFGEAFNVFVDSGLENATRTLLEGIEPEGQQTTAILFTEFHGKQSFSGQHVNKDPKYLRPIDLWLEGRGFMPPDDFVRCFRHFVTPVYQGKLTVKFVENVRKGKLPVNEGVVCKGGTWGSVWACKIKTDKWLARGGEL